jgi:hypothetical protein
MSLASIRTAIETRFNSNWNTTPIAWENVAFTPPDNSPFVTFSIQFGRDDTIAMLKGHRQYGTIEVNIFVPEATGTATALGYADTIAAIYRDVLFSNIHCSGTVIRTVPQHTKGWFQVNVSVPFHSDTLY